MMSMNVTLGRTEGVSLRSKVTFGFSSTSAGLTATGLGAAYLIGALLMIGTT